MPHVSYSELRSKLSSYMDEVCDSRAPLLITRQNARSVVMLAEDEFNAIVETLHLLRSPANADRLLGAVRKADSGALMAHELIEHADR